MEHRPDAQDPAAEAALVARRLMTSFLQASTATLAAGVAVAQQELQRAEEELWRFVRRRLDEVAPVTTPAPPPARLDGPPSPPVLLERLLTASLEQDRHDAEELLHLRVLRSLVPDEARIVAALSEGETHALVDVVTGGSRLSKTTETLLAQVSTVGRAAGVRLPQETPAYLTHLLALGVLRPGPRLAVLEPEYEILAADPAVSAAVAQGGRIVRRSLCLSDLGIRLWRMAQPRDEAPA